MSALAVAVRVIAALAVTAAPIAGVARAAADPELPIECSATPLQTTPHLDVVCHNPASEGGNVALMWACSTPLDFGRQIIFNEPTHHISAGGTLQLVRDCPAGQVVVTEQAFPLTNAQQRTYDDHQRKLRAERDAEQGR